MSLVASPVRPSYKQGFARSAAESAYPELWRGLEASFVPVLGQSGLMLWDVVNSNHATLTGMGLDDWEQSSDGPIVRFGDSNSTYGRIDRNLIGTAPNWTLTARCRIDTSYNNQLYCETTGGTQGRHIIGFDGAELLRYDNSPPSGGVVLGSGAAAPLGEWMTVSYRRSASGIDFFLNGKTTGSGTPDTYSGGEPNQTRIAWYYTNNYFRGGIASMHIHRRALTDNEISELAGNHLLPQVQRRRAPAFAQAVGGVNAMPMAVHYYRQHQQRFQL